MASLEELTEAVRSGEIASAQRLLREQPDLATAREASGASPLLTALYHGNTPLVELLLEAGARPNLWEAAALGQGEVLSQRLTEHPDGTEAWSHDGFTPLQMACYFGRPEAVEFLLERGADVHPASRNGMRVTALHAAVANGEEAIVQHVISLLLERGADLNAVQQGGFTPLQAAAQNGHLRVAQRLLAAGADPTARNEAGETALSLAVKEGHTELAALLGEGPRTAD